jgi:membrane protein
VSQSDRTDATASTLVHRLSRQLKTLRQLLSKDIWELEHIGRHTLRARSYHFLRTLTLTFQGLRRNQLPLQSAALTFYTMIGIGPLIAFGIMISGFLLEQDMSDPSGALQDSVVVEKITELITFAAPHVAVAVEPDGSGSSGTQLSPQMLELIRNFSNAAQSGTVGVVGSLMLLVIGIQVLTSIEKSFNLLWGRCAGPQTGGAHRDVLDFHQPRCGSRHRFPLLNQSQYLSCALPKSSPSDLSSPYSSSSPRP